MTISNSRRGPVKSMGFWVLPCLLSMAAYGAAEKPPIAPASARGGPTSALAAYVFLHQTRDSAPGGARTKACYEQKVQTAQRGEAK